jgi:hypothetical protein
MGDNDRLIKFKNRDALVSFASFIGCALEPLRNQLLFLGRVCAVNSLGFGVFISLGTDPVKDANTGTNTRLFKI